MSGKVKFLGIVIGFIIVFVVAFATHWLLGVGLLVLLVGYSAYANRSLLYIQKGNRAYLSGDTAQALNMMNKAYKANPNRPNHQINYGYMLLKAGKHEEAEHVFKKMLGTVKTRDAKLQAQINLASAYWLQNRRDEAIAILEETYAEFKNTMLYGNLGYFKILNGQLEEALALNLEAYAFNDHDLTTLDNLAQNYYFLGRFEEAEDMYAKAIAMSPRYAETYYYYAQTLKQVGKIEEAREQIAKALDKELPMIPSTTREELEKLAKELG